MEPDKNCKHSSWLLKKQPLDDDDVKILGLNLRYRNLQASYFFIEPLEMNQDREQLHVSQLTRNVTATLQARFILVGGDVTLCRCYCNVLINYFTDFQLAVHHQICRNIMLRNAVVS